MFFIAVKSAVIVRCDRFKLSGTGIDCTVCGEQIYRIPGLPDSIFGRIKQKSQLFIAVPKFFALAEKRQIFLQAADISGRLYFIFKCRKFG